MSKQINILKSTVVPVNIENIDTDQIIPARFLKATDRAGFGKTCFATGDMSRMTNKGPKKTLS